MTSCDEQQAAGKFAQRLGRIPHDATAVQFLGKRKRDSGHVVISIRSPAVRLREVSACTERTSMNRRLFL